jgi:long-chain acyl-CoA synthetase
MLVHEFLEHSAARLPEKEALIAGSSRLTYAALDAEANRLARALRALGVRYGDRVAVLLDNSPETVVSIFGVLKADAVFLVVNPTTKTDKIRYILNNCRAAALVTHAAKWRSVEAAVAAVPSLKAVVLAGKSARGSAAPGPQGDAAGRQAGGAARFGGEVVGWSETLAAQSAEVPPRTAIDIDLAALIYTSGSTGNPKGVMMAHRNIVSASTSITTYLEHRESDIVLDVLPLSFDYGLYQIIMAAQFGGTVVLEKSFLYPYAVINLIRNERVTGFPIVPTISAILLQMEELGAERFEHLRYITNTAAALPVSHITGLQKVFPGVRIYSMYGLTECKRVTYLPPEELGRRPTSVGKGMPNEQVYLVDENDRVITEPNVAGQLVVRGGNVMLGYWELPEETAAMLRPGRLPGEMVLYTGDLFKMDEEGFLYFLARGDDIIKSRGEKVSPKEVENALYAIDGILEAVVAGVPDPVLGEAIKAYVVRTKGSTLTEKDVLARCAASLEDFMVPKYVEFRDELPKTSTGKITRKGL